MSFGEFYLIFALGLVSSLHCVQMCGPIVLSYSLPLGKHTRRQQFFAHLSYNAGRILTYTVLGLMAGLAGGTIGFIGKLAGVGNIAAIIGGALMVIAGLLMLDLIPSRNLQRFDPLKSLSRWLNPIGWRLSSPTILSKFSLGVMLGFLPCGLVYAALLRAIATGEMLAGALTMLAFGLGTTSALLVLGMFSSVISLKLGRWGSRLAAVSVTLLGAFLVWRGVMPFISGSAPTECHQ
ncbi:MAG: sulfite exporter TauE/SafE family protein [Acidobacteriota bacterium]